MVVRNIATERGIEMAVGVHKELDPGLLASVRALGDWTTMRHVSRTARDRCINTKHFN